MPMEMNEFNGLILEIIKKVIKPGGVSQRSQVELNSKLDLKIMESH